MMEEARISETLAIFYQTTRRYNPENSHLQFSLAVLALNLLDMASSYLIV
jgi:hypothetical protein